jgi:hypothetical protein
MLRPTQSRHDLGAHRGPSRLAGVVAQGSADELDGVRHLVAGDTVAQERLHRLLIQRRRRLDDCIRHLPEILVGDANNQAGQHIRMRRCSVISRRNSCGSNQSIRTRCWRITSAIAAALKPVVWVSGTGITPVSPSWAPRAYPSAGPSRLSPPASISFGRPVLPPEPIDLQHGDTASGNGSSDSAWSGTKP